MQDQKTGQLSHGRPFGWTSNNSVSCTDDDSSHLEQHRGYLSWQIQQCRSMSKLLRAWRSWTGEFGKIPPFPNFLLNYSTRTCSTWFTRLLPKLLDVVGDFAGQELFVVDGKRRRSGSYNPSANLVTTGDALIQYVLDNELLRLGNAGEPSFQLLHATWLLETTIGEMLKRDCTFEIVFFACTQFHSRPHQDRRKADISLNHFSQFSRLNSHWS